jgi:hypothetical protein
MPGQKTDLLNPSIPNLRFAPIRVREKRMNTYKTIETGKELSKNKQINKNKQSAKNMQKTWN